MDLCSYLLMISRLLSKAVVNFLLLFGRIDVLSEYLWSSTPEIRSMHFDKSNTPRETSLFLVSLMEVEVSDMSVVSMLDSGI